MAVWQQKSCSLEQGIVKIFVRDVKLKTQIASIAPAGACDPACPQEMHVYGLVFRLDLRRRVIMVAAVSLSCSAVANRLMSVSVPAAKLFAA